jgi:anaerobic ribonucleoside-triphosphate reductase activating protein
MSAPLPAAHRGLPTGELRVARVSKHPTFALGPGRRHVVWVQGCALRCAGCVVPESHDVDAGDRTTPVELSKRLLAMSPVDGVTLTGGEPFIQARGLLELVRRLRVARPVWTFMSYSGYREPVLESRGTADQRALLAELDLLVDGPYVERRAEPLRWRGSSNQQIRVRTPAGARAMAGLDDYSQGVEIELGADGTFAWTGVPPDGFRAALDAALERAGLVVERVPAGASSCTNDDRKEPEP